MKRITNACLEQTLRFSVQERVSPDADRASIQSEYEHYKKQMTQKRIQYEILSEDAQADGTLVVRIKRQYNTYPCGDYFA